MRRVMLSILGVATVGATASGQNARSCADLLGTPTPDSARSTLAATVQSFNPRRPLPAQHAQLLADGLREMLKLPRPLLLPAYEGDSITTPAGKRWMAVPSMSVVFGLTLQGNKITRVRRIAGVSSVTFDSAVVRAVAELDSTGLLPPLAEDVGPEPLEVSLSIGRVPLRTVQRALTNPAEVVVPLFLVRLPAHAVSRQTAPQKEFAQFAPQPPSPRTDEAVVVRVLVLPDGSVDQESMQVMAFSSAGYIKNVFDVIPKWRFSPLELSGCPVPALEELGFTPATGAPRNP